MLYHLTGFISHTLNAKLISFWVFIFCLLYLSLIKNAWEQEDTNLSSGQKIFFLVVRSILRQRDCVNNLTLKLTSIYRWGAQQLKSENLFWIYKKLWLCTTSIIIWVCQKVVTTTSATSGSALQSAKMWRNSKQFWQATKNVSED